MTNLFKKATKSQIKVTTLILVYVFRMAFFQTLIASPNIAHVSIYKLTIAQHQSKNRPHVPVMHRSHVQKHTISKVNLPQILPVSAFQFSSLVIKPEKIYPFKSYKPQRAVKVSDDALELYRLYHTLLI